MNYTQKNFTYQLGYCGTSEEDLAAVGSGSFSCAMEKASSALTNHSYHAHVQ